MKVSLVKECVHSFKNDLFELAQELVRFPSITGDETQAQRYLAQRWQEWGLHVDLWIPEAEDVVGHPAFCDNGLPIERANIVSQWGEGDPKRAALILNGHMDVVPVGDPSQWDGDPFSGSIYNDTLYGRGSCDMKGGLAAMSFAVLAARELGVAPKRPILLQSVIGEETGGLGTLAAIVRGYRADAAVIGEPTRLTMSPVASGALSFRLRVAGRSAHGALPATGVSAIEKFWMVWKALRELENKRHLGFHHRAFRDEPIAAPISIGKFQAGDWPSTLPDEAIVEGRFGIFPGEEPIAARHVLETTLRELSENDDWLKDHPVQVEWFEGQFEPGETDAEAPILAQLAKAHHDITQQDLVSHGVPYGCDLRLLTRYANTPTVLYGPGNVLNAHTANEHIALDEIVTATEVLTMLIASTTENT
jgi:acetylornithine deacetylase